MKTRTLNLITASLLLAAKTALGEPTWQYEEHMDEMGRGLIKSASLESLTRLDLGPYEGPQPMRLTVVKSPQLGVNISFSVERGQFLFDSFSPDASAPTGKLTVKFDDGSPKSLLIYQGHSGQSNVAFIGAPTDFLRGLRKAKELRVEAYFYNRGSRVAVFDVHGLEW